MAQGKNKNYAFLRGLNAAQYEAVTTSSKSTLVLAGAGSGKTRVLTTRIAWFVEELKIPPESILALTFTNKAAQEMRERAQQFSSAADRVLLTTFHSFGVRFLRDYAGLLQFPRYFSIYDDEESLRLMKALFPEHEIPELKSLYYQIQRWKDGSLGQAEQIDLQSVFVEFNNALRKNRAVDFGDLIYLPVQYLKQYPVLRQQVQARWQAILVDEYQDTNMRQAQLLMSMISEKTFVTIVGDDDQSIYKFRGAEPTNMIDFTHQFPETQIVKLEENYRSTQPILVCANHLIDRNTGRLGKTLYTQKQDGHLPRLHAFFQQEDENQFICELINQNQHSETAILYRTNAQSRSLETALTQHHIPYRIIGALRFYQREEIKTTLAWLSFLINAHDQASFMRLTEKPSRGIGNKTLEIIFSFYHEDRNLLGAVESALPNLKGKAKTSCQHLVQLFQKWHIDIEQMELSDFIKMFLSESGILEFYTQQDHVQHTERLANIESLAASLCSYSDGIDGLAQFLEHVALQQELVESQDNEEPQVKLMTIHNAKGLEFDRVILVGMEEGLFPRENIYSDELEEERRLCYVAITRAKSDLYLTYVRDKNIYGKWMHCTPSRFLLEIGKENMEMGREFKPKVSKIEKKSVTGMGGQTFSPGEWIVHKDYGRGEIVNAVQVSGRYIIEIIFESGRRAKFLPEFIPLQKIENPGN